jgi:hypothetical protein
VGAIIASAPTVKPLADLLGLDEPTVRRVALSWGPGKFDASLILDGKAFRPDGKSGAVLIPAAYGLAGVSQHTYTGWGGVSHWNALVANLEMGGSGTFWDPRLNDMSRFPIAAKAGFGNRRPEKDLITRKLAALQMYQLAIPAPSGERAHFDFNARRGAELFNGKARCSNCPCSAPLHGTCLEYAHSGKRLESMHSRLSGHPTGATGRHRSEESPREKKEVIIMTAVFARCATSLSITTAI